MHTHRHAHTCTHMHRHPHTCTDRQRRAHTNKQRQTQTYTHCHTAAIVLVLLGHTHMPTWHTPTVRVTPSHRHARTQARTPSDHVAIALVLFGLPSHSTVTYTLSVTLQRLRWCCCGHIHTKPHAYAHAVTHIRISTRTHALQRLRWCCCGLPSHSTH